MQDAANLSWKLAAVLRGAPEALLDSYQSERHPVGRAVLRSSGAIIRAAMIRSSLGRAVRGFLGDHVLSVPRIREKVTGQLTGIGYHYPAPSGAHPSVGTRAQDRTFADGTRLYEALRGQHFVLTGAEDVTPWSDRVRTTGPTDGPMTLVRPDGYVGWAGTDPGDLRETLTALVGKP
ncbi:FAD binding domain-containing protein [Actinophytocola oryzae]|uniref:FAD binding domain-containing protein n=2 Tax=Actinophytocola oryzae TaxID=502181 RepID=A0A4V3FV04_9PSEU|nr:FAD binding domain-containing protein [Actinophytocola oryzae]